MSIDPTTVPKPADNIETVVFDGEAVLFHEPSRSVHRLNATAAAVWLLADGSSSVAAISAELAAMFGIEPSAAADHVAEALELLCESGLLDGDASGAADTPPVEHPPLLSDDGTVVIDLAANP